MVILIMGPQGSGKTTQAEMLANELGLEFVPMGKILRGLFEKHDPLGIEAHGYWEKGDLVPDEMMRKVVEKYFKTHPISAGVVMDGFPRDLPQYEWMESVFGEPVTAVVEIMLDINTILRRLNKRRRIENRDDETPKAIAVRLKHYQEDTLPLLDRFRKDGVPVISIDGDTSIEKIQAEILKELESYIR